MKLEGCTRKELMKIIRKYLSAEEQETAFDYIQGQRKEDKEREISSWKAAEEYNRKKYDDLKNQVRNAGSENIRILHDDMVSASKACDYAKMRQHRLLKEIKEMEKDHG